MKSELNQYYSIGAVIAVGVIGGIGYYIYRTKKGPASREVSNRGLQPPTGEARPQNPPNKPIPQNNKFEMD